MRKFFYIIFAICAVCLADVLEDLGCTHAELLQKKGIPNALFPVRQQKPTLDDIVFVYEDSYYYIYNNHFYRAFFTKRHIGEIYKGLQIGAPKSALTTLWGNNYQLERDGLVWNKPGFIIVAKITTENALESIWFIKEERK